MQRLKKLDSTKATKDKEGIKTQDMTGTINTETETLTRRRDAREETHKRTVSRALSNLKRLWWKFQGIFQAFFFL